MNPETRLTLHLPRGASRMWRAVAGTELIARCGKVDLTLLSLPLGDRSIALAATLERGQVRRIADAGWVRLGARTDSELVLVLPSADPRWNLRRVLRGIIRIVRTSGRAARA